jgi:hypothetical protein
VLYNKPIAVGAAILGISKAKLADFWYGCINKISQSRTMYDRYR